MGWGPRRGQVRTRRRRSPLPTRGITLHHRACRGRPPPRPWTTPHEANDALHACGLHEGDPAFDVSEPVSLKLRQTRRLRSPQEMLDIYPGVDLLAEYRTAFGAGNVLHAPIKDFQLMARPTWHRIEAFLEESKASGTRCVIHCQGGNGRSGQAAAAWIVPERGLSPEEAIRLAQLQLRDPEEALHLEKEPVKRDRMRRQLFRLLIERRPASGSAVPISICTAKAVVTVMPPAQAGERTSLRVRGWPAGATPCPRGPRKRTGSRSPSARPRCRSPARGRTIPRKLSRRPGPLF
jgi:protein-tyrosine phosphatase